MEEITIDDNHNYTIKGSDAKLISVTTLIKRWFNMFNEDEVIYKIMTSQCEKTKNKYCNDNGDEDDKSQIIKKWNNMRNNGVLLHATIEKYLIGGCVYDKNHMQRYKSKIGIEFDYFLNFLKRHNNLKLHAAEKIIYSKDKKIAGTVDCIMIDDKNKYYLIDWKCSNEIRPWSLYQGYGPFSNINDCNYNHYTLQLNIYRHILETNYDMKIDYMWLVNFHRNNKNYNRYNILSYDIGSIWDELLI